MTEIEAIQEVTREQLWKVTQAEKTLKLCPKCGSSYLVEWIFQSEKLSKCVRCSYIKSTPQPAGEVEPNPNEPVCSLCGSEFVTFGADPECVGCDAPWQPVPRRDYKAGEVGK